MSTIAQQPDHPMPDIPPPPTTQTQQLPKASKSTTLFSSTLKSPPYAYAHLQLHSDSPASQSIDNLQLKAYITAALRQFLGDTGAAIPMDILKVDGPECWVRVPRQDLGAFSGAVTAFPGQWRDGELTVLRLRGCGDWLGGLVGRRGEEEVWGR